MLLFLDTIVEYLYWKSSFKLNLLEFQSVTNIPWDSSTGIRGKISYADKPSSITKSKPPVIIKQ